MRRVVATGTFEIVHPGHLYYLEESRRLGDELFVIVARDVNVRHKPCPVIPEEQRVRVVAALRPVDHALLGDSTDIFRPIREIMPDIVTLGFNQHFEEAALQSALVDQGLSTRVVRIGKYDGPLCSSRMVMKRILEIRGKDTPCGA